jgi:HD-GYP domain-containing protein (c-di-GMP phosphodiesterase class II)
VAGHVALSQALAYARDLKALYEGAQARERELETANARLRAAYEQAVRHGAELKTTHRRLQRAFFQSLLGLANALDAKDACTRGHSERVAGWARRLAQAAGLSDVVAERLAQAGLLHDLGKIGVPEAILRKPGPLSEEEWETMRRHPVVGAQIVAPLEFFEDGAAVIRHHHERHDGSGYPDGLAGAAIPLGARIIAVADVWDAVTSDRPYRASLSRAEAMRLMETEAGRGLDPGLTARFLSLVDRAPADAPV